MENTHSRGRYNLTTRKMFHFVYLIQLFFDFIRTAVKYLIVLLSRNVHGVEGPREVHVSCLIQINPNPNQEISVNCNDHVFISFNIVFRFKEQSWCPP